MGNVDVTTLSVNYAANVSMNTLDTATTVILGGGSTVFCLGDFNQGTANTLNKGARVIADSYSGTDMTAASGAEKITF